MTTRLSERMRQLASYGGAGLGAMVAHYGALILLVETGGVHPVPATLVGFVCGGLVSYGLNRRFTFATSRTHAEAGWRFGVVAAIGFVATFLLMYLFVSVLGLPYLLMQLVTTPSSWRSPSPGTSSGASASAGEDARACRALKCHPCVSGLQVYLTEIRTF